MKKENKLYIIISYIFFILPPFIWLIVELYSIGPSENTHIASLIGNVLVYAVLTLVIYLVSRKSDLSFPTDTEKKHLLFGLIGNVTIYFYTFQNFLNIEGFVTIYLVLIIILAVYYLLFAKEFKPLELWILAPTFLIIDTIHFLYTGCGFTESYSCVPVANPIWFIYGLYWIIVLVSLGYYIMKTINIRPFSILKYINIGLVVTLSIVVENFIDFDTKFVGTLLIAFPFFIIVDFIISIVNKTYQSKTIIFYIRTTTILAIMIYLNLVEFWTGNADKGILGVMVAIIYISLVIVILSRLLHVETDLNIIQKTKVKFIPVKDHIENILLFEYLNEVKENELLFVATTSDNVSSYQLVTLTDVRSFKEAQLIPYDNETLMIYLDKIESYLRSLGVYQIKIVLVDENEKLFKKNYTYLYNNETNIYLKKL